MSNGSTGSARYPTANSCGISCVGTQKKWQRLYRGLLALLVSSSSLSPFWNTPSASAQIQPYCRFTKDSIAKKQNLRQNALKGKQDAQRSYKALIREHSERLWQCRSQSWPRVQAIWLRLYPCDSRPGGLEAILDRLVDLGYNQVYVEVFYDGQVLLPAAENNTPWPSVLRSPGSEKVDLLAQAIQKGHERGLRVYAWMFSMNFGYNYALLSNRQPALARNGKGQISLQVIDDGSQVFVDPYNQQARTDYYQMVQAIAQRRPDGILFDYIRYPRQSGAASIATQVKDLWIYSEASQQALYRRAQNKKGLELIRRYISRGYISASDIEAVNKLYPDEGSPLWQGRTPSPLELQLTPGQLRPVWQAELWQLTVAHAAQGVIDFLAIASYPAQQQRISAGAVFFPEGNQVIGQGYDSRLQPWHSFSSSIEWHPMSYALCRGSTQCIAAQVQRVLSQAQPNTQVAPVIAGIWGQNINDRPSLEAQMEAIRRVAPQLDSVSHFAYSWQEPEIDNTRKFCKLR